MKFYGVGFDSGRSGNEEGKSEGSMAQGDVLSVESAYIGFERKISAAT